MEQTKLIEVRKSKGFSQQQIAEKLFMDVSGYNRREKGQVKINFVEWENLAKILDVQLDEIYESDEKQVIICKDNASINNQGTNNIYTVPQSLLDTQEKYIKILEEKIKELENKR